MFNVKRYLIEILLFVKKKNNRSGIFANNECIDGYENEASQSLAHGSFIAVYDAWIYEVNSLNYQEFQKFIVYFKGLT